MSSFSILLIVLMTNLFEHHHCPFHRQISLFSVWFCFYWVWTSSLCQVCPIMSLHCYTSLKALRPVHKCLNSKLKRKIIVIITGNTSTKLKPKISAAMNAITCFITNSMGYIHTYIHTYIHLNFVSTYTIVQQTLHSH